MKSPLVLAVETSTYVGSAALVKGSKVLCQRFFEPTRGHGGILLKEVHALFQEADLSVQDIDLFAAGSGPGSFTGVRVGLSTLQAMAWAAGRPVTAIASLWVLAHNLVTTTGYIAPVLDARRQEVYGALYRSNGQNLEEVLAPNVASPEQWAETLCEAANGSDIAYVGSGVLAYPDIFPTIHEDHRMHAGKLGQLAAEILSKEGVESLPNATPRYVRPSQAELLFGQTPTHNPVDNLDPKATL